jgi:hypothetical protein
MRRKLIIEARIEVPLPEDAPTITADNLDIAQQEALKMLQEKFIDEGAEFEVFAELREVD